MKKIYTYIKYSALAMSIFAFAVFVLPQSAFAGGENDWGYGGYGDDDYSYEISPNYYSSGNDYDYEISPNYYQNSTPSYNYSSGGYQYTPSYSSGTGYQYYPSSQYTYTPSRSSGSTSSGAPNYQYVYSSNSNSNSNSNTNTNTATAHNTNTITNTFNPVNNNDARINLVVLGGTSGTNNNTQALNGSCTISPSTTYINQDVTFSASASGGNGNYTYSWTGDNGIYSSSQSFTGRFSYVGVKNATVTIRSGSESITRTCSVTVQDNTYYPPVYPPVNNAYCVANPTVAGVNQNVTWTVYPGNNAYGYSYNWSGTDGLSGYGQTINRVYSTPGYKTATVTLYGNGQSYVVNCATTIQGGSVLSNVTVIRDQVPTGTPVAGVFLNQVPDTGISFGLKLTLFVLGLLSWSVFGAYMFSRKTKLVSAHISANGAQTGTGLTLSRIEAFKRANMVKKGIIA
jgi:hypothetical protein